MNSHNAELHYRTGSSTILIPPAAITAPSPLITPVLPGHISLLLAGRKHPSTPPPPPIPTRSPRRPKSTALSNGVNLFKGTTSESKNIKDKEGGACEDAKDPKEVGGRSLHRVSSHQSNVDEHVHVHVNEQVNRGCRQKAHQVVDDIDREASNVCEFIEDQLYFMWTPINPINTRRTTYLTIDEYLHYETFFSDFGPFDISDIFRFCYLLKERYELAKSMGKVLCLHTNPEDLTRANAAFALCCYMMLLQNKTPEEAYAPIEFVYPEIKPFRDAGCGPSTYYLTILDCLHGLQKGLDLGLLRLDQFDVKEYKYYEQPCNGDFNWITPSFIAFAGPTDRLTYAELQRRQTIKAANAVVVLAGLGSRQEGDEVSVSEFSVSSMSSTSSGEAASALSTRSATPSSTHSSGVSRIPTPSSFSTECGKSMEGGKDGHDIPTPETLSTFKAASSDTTEKDQVINQESNRGDQDKDDDTDMEIKEKKKTRKPRAHLKKDFQNVLDYFGAHNVNCVIRLNDRMYDEKHFQALGIEHKDLIYPDGTCPPSHIVREFLEICVDVIEKNSGVVAVHCMAGLGRTGTLIGAYLMRKYDLTAKTTIAFLRLMRPGSVVGPQQNWLAENESFLRGHSLWDYCRDKSTTSSTAATGTPATDYDQVFSRANSAGLESRLPGIGVEDEKKIEVEEKLIRIDLYNGYEASAGVDHATVKSLESEGGSMGESRDRQHGSSNSTQKGDSLPTPWIIAGPRPLPPQHSRQISVNNLERLSAGFERGSVVDEDEDKEQERESNTKSKYDADIGTLGREHVGATNYVIPIQPRKLQPHHHRHHQHPHANSSDAKGGRERAINELNDSTWLSSDDETRAFIPNKNVGNPPSPSKVLQR
ncbi:Dual specificity protein phosphatase cdc14a [Mortierella polycephala]|uniref:protein-tyrosine-phosphatase n=1 Tax=Mortierella polycephala TaxID=41804 RepID=A0A9P6U004_9FUNG|nr:Dual specificity protein phosphatase cdc14a [Mortierella polycephala]